MKKRAIQIGVAFLLFLLAILLSFENQFIHIGIYIVSYLVVGLNIVLKAIRNIVRGKVFDENFLMSVATIGAFAIGEYPEAVAVMLFYQVGELFQSYAVDKSRKSIASLMDIRPDYANVKREEEVLKVEPEEVKIGEWIVVKPGEKIPIDGIVIEGNSLIDTAALTGEAVPRKVTIGDEILSGSVNQNGVLTIQTTKEFGESTVTKILDLVENASSKKSKSESFITKFAKYYTPTVVIIAVLLAVLPPIFIKEASFVDWFYRALSFLVVSCPCALVISIPLGFFGGIGAASKIGVLVKGSNYLEALAQTEMVVFDKTGTLTKGVFEVQKVDAIGIEKEELIRLAAYAEKDSNHPIAQSLKQAYGKEIEATKIEKMQELSGLGIEAIVEGKKMLVGNDKLMKEKKIAYHPTDEIGTVIYIAIDQQFAGYIVIADQIKEDAKTTIETLKKNNIKKTVMLTGDRKTVGEAVASKLEMDLVYTELLPDGKVKKVEELLKEKSPKGKLAFVGDGINDAPVLAISDIGIAMGAIGSDAAIEAADLVIMTDEPSKIGKAIAIAKKTMGIVKQNIVFAIVIKIGVLLLSACGLSTMWEAVFADVGVSVLAILNALRVLRVKK